MPKPKMEQSMLYDRTLNFIYVTVINKLHNKNQFNGDEYQLNLLCSYIH